MNKKTLGVIVAVIIVCIVGVGTFFLLNNKNLGSEKEEGKNRSELTSDKKQNSEKDTNSKGNGKILVVYYSATNHTKSVAEKLSKNLGGDIFEIIPEDPYTSDDLDWTDNKSRVSKEHNDESLQNVKLKTTKVDNWDSYDTILIGYPIWWGTAAWPVNTFVKANDFNGKTVIPFCTSSSSGLGQSGELLESVAKGGNWLEGHRFSSSPSDSDVKKFIDSIQ